MYVIPRRYWDLNIYASEFLETLEELFSGVKIVASDI